MKKNTCYILSVTLLFALIFLTVNRAKATTVLGVSFDQLVQGSELIFEGRVVSKETRLLPGRDEPFTYFTFQLFDVIKGSYTDSTIEIGFMGGKSGDMTLKVSNMRMPELNEHGIYFVESLGRRQVHPFYGWSQGHYLVVMDKTDEVEKVFPVDQHVYPGTASRASLKAHSTVSDFKKAIINLTGGR